MRNCITETSVLARYTTTNVRYVLAHMLSSYQTANIQAHARVLQLVLVQDCYTGAESGRGTSHTAQTTSSCSRMRLSHADAGRALRSVPIAARRQQWHVITLLQQLERAGHSAGQLTLTCCSTRLAKRVKLHQDETGRHACSLLHTNLTNSAHNIANQISAA